MDSSSKINHRALRRFSFSAGIPSLGPSSEIVAYALLRVSLFDLHRGGETFAKLLRVITALSVFPRVAIRLWNTCPDVLATFVLLERDGLAVMFLKQRGSWE